MRGTLVPALLLLAGCSRAAPPAPVAPAPVPAPSPSEPLPPLSPAVTAPGRTVFLPHLDAPFDPEKENGIWCATFPMAWDALGREIVKGPPLLGPPAPPGFAEGMNRHPFPREALDPATCIAVAGTKASGILVRIREEGRRRFGKELPSREISLSDPESILAYAFLRKDLPFEFPFETLLAGIRFAGAKEPVRAFGVKAGSRNPRLDDIVSQVAVLFDRGKGKDREFGIGIRCGRDELILARVRPCSSLRDTWSSATSRLAAVPAPLPREAVLGIPKVHFDLDHEFAEIHGAHLLNPGFEPYFVEEAWQSLLLRMDETGLVVKSGAGLKVELEEEPEPPPTYVLDQPFLVALREKGAKEPYLLVWIANTDLMPE